MNLIAPGIQVHHDPAMLSRLAQPWRALQTDAPDPYLDPLWYQIWWRSFGHSAQLWLFEQIDPEPAFVPMMVENRILSLIGNIYSHRQSVAIQNDPLLLWSRLLPVFESFANWDTVLLYHLRRNDPVTVALRQCARASGLWLELPGERERWAIPEAHHTWQEHLWHQGRESRRKRRRTRRRLVEHGNYRFQVYTTPEEAQEFAKIYFRVMVRSWKPPDSSRDFFRELCRRTAEHDWFRSYALFINDEPVAFQLGFLMDATYFCYKTAYHQRYSPLSPGIAVMDYALADVMTHGAEKVDLLTGDDVYKALWCNHEIQQVGFVARR